MSSSKSSNKLFYSQLFSGIGMGILLGIIMGLSVSPVVKTILGALSAMLAAFLGLQESLFAKQGEEDQAKITNRIFLNGIRAGSFGLATVIALLFGMYLRTHEVLSLSIEEQVDNWTKAGFDDPLAEELVIYQKFKLFKKEGLLHIDAKQAELAAEKMNASDGFLFSKEEMQNYCISLDVENKWGNSVQNALEGYEGMDPNIINYAKELRPLPEAGQSEIMNAVKNLVCFLGNGSDADYKNFCNNLHNVIDYSKISGSLEEITISSDIKEMAMLAYALLNQIESEDDRSSMMKAIISITCDE